MDYTALYTDEDKRILKIAEDSLNPKVDRIDEIIAYGKAAGIKRIGIAHCVAFQKEAERLEQKLSIEGFAVDKVNCKLGRVPFSDLVADYKGTSCNPAGQANYLYEKDTELNIAMGFCLGHDMIFNAKSKAPVTPLVVKDRKLGHHTLHVLKKKKVGISVSK